MRCVFILSLIIISVPKLQTWQLISKLKISLRRYQEDSIIQMENQKKLKIHCFMLIKKVSMMYHGFQDDLIFIILLFMLPCQIQRSNKKMRMKFIFYQFDNYKQKNTQFLTVNMIEQDNQQNSTLFTVQSLDLDFSKSKKRNKSAIICSSDRNNNQPPQTNYETQKTDRSVLIEKKKNYSNAIRSRNQNLLTKKKKSLIFGQCGQYQSKELKNLIEIKENIETQPLAERKQTNNKKLNHSSSKKILYKKSFDSVCSLDIQPIPLMRSAEQTSIIQSKEPRIYSASTFELHEQKPQLEEKEQRLSKQKLCSNVYSERVYVFDSDATVLMRQNTTFKRDLANFRKQNSQLRKQLQNAKKHAEQLEEKTKSILEGSLLSCPKLSEGSLEQAAEIISETNDNSAQIIQKLREQILELKSLNSSLQLKAYMAQKRVVEEVAICKKKMAKQLGDWREKCAKLRAENMKFKSFRDMTISMEISKDEQ